MSTQYDFLGHPRPWFPDGRDGEASVGTPYVGGGIALQYGVLRRSVADSQSTTCGQSYQGSKSMSSMGQGEVDMMGSKGLPILGRKGGESDSQGNGLLHLVFRGRTCVSARLASRKSSGAS